MKHFRVVFYSGHCVDVQAENRVGAMVVARLLYSFETRISNVIEVK